MVTQRLSIKEAVEERREKGSASEEADSPTPLPISSSSPLKTHREVQISLFLRHSLEIEVTQRLSIKEAVEERREKGSASEEAVLIDYRSLMATHNKHVILLKVPYI
jgi:hypothetical protein